MAEDKSKALRYDGVLRFEVPNISTSYETVRGQYCTFKDVPWRIVVTFTTKDGVRSLGVFLQASPDSTGGMWSVDAQAELRLISSIPKRHLIRRTHHVYSQNEDDWGYSSYVTFNDIMDERKGYYNKAKDSVIICVAVRVNKTTNVASLSEVQKKIADLMRIAQLQCDREQLDKALEANLAATKLCKDRSKLSWSKLMAQKEMIVFKKVEESIKRIETGDRHCCVGVGPVKRAMTHSHCHDHVHHHPVGKKTAAKLSKMAVVDKNRRLPVKKQQVHVQHSYRVSTEAAIPLPLNVDRPKVKLDPNGASCSRSAADMMRSEVMARLEQEDHDRWAGDARTVNRVMGCCVGSAVFEKSKCGSSSRPGSAQTSCPMAKLEMEGKACPMGKMEMEGRVKRLLCCEDKSCFKYEVKFTRPEAPAAASEPCEPEETPVLEEDLGSEPEDSEALSADEVRDEEVVPRPPCCLTRCSQFVHRYQDQLMEVYGCLRRTRDRQTHVHNHSISRLEKADAEFADFQKLFEDFRGEVKKVEKSKLHWRVNMKQIGEHIDRAQKELMKAAEMRDDAMNRRKREAQSHNDLMRSLTAELQVKVRTLARLAETRNEKTAACKKIESQLSSEKEANIQLIEKTIQQATEYELHALKCIYEADAKKFQTTKQICKHKIQEVQNALQRTQCLVQMKRGTMNLSRLQECLDNCEAGLHKISFLYQNRKDAVRSGKTLSQLGKFAQMIPPVIPDVCDLTTPMSNENDEVFHSPAFSPSYSCPFGPIGPSPSSRTTTSSSSFGPIGSGRSYVKSKADQNPLRATTWKELSEKLNNTMPKLPARLSDSPVLFSPLPWDQDPQYYNKIKYPTVIENTVRYRQSRDEEQRQ